MNRDVVSLNHRPASQTLPQPVWKWTFIIDDNWVQLLSCTIGSSHYAFFYLLVKPSQRQFQLMLSHEAACLICTDTHTNTHTPRPAFLCRPDAQLSTLHLKGVMGCSCSSGETRLRDHKPPTQANHTVRETAEVYPNRLIRKSRCHLTK